MHKGLSTNSYNPFGMLLEGRNWEGGSEYRYGFNTQEQDDEVYGNGNLNTAEFWEYDTRLGRRWNVDPKEMPNVGPYTVFLNNPIAIIDVMGDTTLFINATTNKILACITAQTDGNYAVILYNLNEEEVKYFSSLDAQSSLSPGLGYDAAVRRSTGSSDKNFQLYDISAMQKMWTLYQHSQPTLNYPLWWVEGQMYNDQSGTPKRVDILYNERIAPLKKVGNLITVDFSGLENGPFDVSKGMPFTAEVESVNQYGKIHLHVNYRGKYFYYYGTSKIGDNGYSYGPSPDDIFAAPLANSKYFDIAVDYKNIYLYQYNPYAEGSSDKIIIPLNLKNIETN